MHLSLSSTRRILRGVAWGAAVVAPLLLLLDLSVSFLRDWPNHLWFITYYGVYFRQHGDLPSVVNVAPVVGIALPVFYAWLLYPLLGILAAALGAALALRLALFAMVAIQFWALLSAGRRIFGQLRVAYVVAVSVIWATYSLTNLYNRGALAEYFGAGFLFTAIGFAASAAVVAPGATRRFQGWLAGVFLLLAIGAHPPTAVLAAAFAGVLGAGLIVGWWRRGRPRFTAIDGVIVVGGALGGTLVLAPWVYASGLWGDKLSVTRDFGGLQFVPEHCDTFWGRFAPFPYDAISLVKGIWVVTPYLEAPVSVVLLGILLWNLELCRRSLHRTLPAGATVSSSPAREITGVATGWFVFLTVLSLSPWLAERCGFLAPYVQFVYRLVSHCNAALLTAVFASGVLVARQGGYRRFRHQTNIVLAVGLTVAVLGLGIKLSHGAVAAASDDNPPHPMLEGLVGVAQAYDTPGLVRKLRSEELKLAGTVTFPVGRSGADFGQLGPLKVERQHAGWMRTNAVVFPWLTLECDGQVLRADQLAQTDHFLAVYLPPGVHQLRAVWQPDRIWSVLNRLSQGAFALVLLFTLGWAAARQFGARRVTGIT